jgi:hypothetical protein
MKTSGISAFVIAALVSGTIGFAGTVRAGWTRHAVTACSATDRNVHVGHQARNAHEHSADVYCAVPDTEEREAHTIGGVGIWAFDGSRVDTVRLSVCSVPPDSHGIDCKLWAVGGAPQLTGKVELFAGSAFWAERPGHFKFLAVSLPGKLGADFESHFDGFTTF